ncbi:DUF4783 domain-containing protein [Compostibacter hankyongensis]
MDLTITLSRTLKWMGIGAVLMSFVIAADPFKDVQAALKEGDAVGLAKYFDTMVEVALPGNANSYSKSQAEIVLRDFFAKNAVKDFKLIHKGSSGEGSVFGIGSLSTAGGVFRTTFFFRQKGDLYKLQELRFEKK